MQLKPGYYLLSGICVNVDCEDKSKNRATINIKCCNFGKERQRYREKQTDRETNPGRQTDRQTDREKSETERDPENLRESDTEAENQRE